MDNNNHKSLSSKINHEPLPSKMDNSVPWATYGLKQINDNSVPLENGILVDNEEYVKNITPRENETINFATNNDGAPWAKQVISNNCVPIIGVLLESYNNGIPWAKQDNLNNGVILENGKDGVPLVKNDNTDITGVQMDNGFHNANNNNDGVLLDNGIPVKDNENYNAKVLQENTRLSILLLQSPIRVLQELLLGQMKITTTAFR